MIKRWFHRDESDPSGLTFVEWEPAEKDVEPDVETPPVAMLIKTPRSCAAPGLTSSR